MKTERHYIESSYAEVWTTGIRKHPPSHYRTVIEFIGLLAPKSGDVVVEIGTGEGRFIPLLSKRQICYVGVDVCRRMFKYAMDYVISSNKNYVHFVVAEAKHLPFKSKSIDKCFCYATMFFIPNKKQAIYEMVRISRQRVLIELRNILSPKIFSTLLKRRIVDLLVRQPYFPDTPLQIFKYFPRSCNVYCFSKGKLEKYDLQSKKWWFKPALIMSIDLIDRLRDTNHACMGRGSGHKQGRHRKHR